MSANQRALPPLDETLLAEILGLALADPVPHRQMVSLCDTVGGRLAGTAAGARGEEWGLQVMREAGLRRVRLQRFETETWVRGECEVELLEGGGRPLPALAHGFTPGEADVTASLIDAGHGLAEDYKRLRGRARGKLVLLRDGSPPGAPHAHRSRKYELAVEAGAAGMLLVSGLTGQRPQTGMCAESEGPIPSVGVTKEDGEFLLRRLADGARLRAHVRLVNRVERATVANVLGDLPGTADTPELVVIGGHLDSWDVAQGAMDNALGCAVTLGAARVLKRLGRRARRTIRFAMWGAEEIGILGSREYVRQARKHLDDHVAYLNYDMPGDPKKLGVAGRGSELSVLQPLTEQLIGLGICAPPSDGVNMATDTRPFFFAGVPCLSAFGPHDSGSGCYHSSSDTVDKVDPGIVRRAAACAAVMAFAIADAPERPFLRATKADVERVLATLGEYDRTVESRDLLLAP